MLSNPFLAAHRARLCRHAARVGVAAGRGQPRTPGDLHGRPRRGLTMRRCRPGQRQPAPGWRPTTTRWGALCGHRLFEAHAGWLSKLFSLCEIPPPLHLKRRVFSAGAWRVQPGAGALYPATSTAARVQALVGVWSTSRRGRRGFGPRRCTCSGAPAEGGLAEQEQARPVSGTVVVQQLSSPPDLLQGRVGCGQALSATAAHAFSSGAL